MAHVITPVRPAAVEHAPGPARWRGLLRVTGQLVADAVLTPTLGTPPGMLLRLRLQPPSGLHYLASVDLGTELADHMAAEAMLPHLRRGAVLSVAAEALALRADHGEPALRLVEPHSVLLLEPPPAAAAQEQTP